MDNPDYTDIIREIKFPLEYWQATIHTLKLFAEAVGQMALEPPAAVRILQEELTISMSIETEGLFAMFEARVNILEIKG